MESRTFASRLVPLALPLALAASGCKPSAAAGIDAGPDARAPIDAGGDALAPTAGGSAVGEGGIVDDGALPAATGDELTLRARHLLEAVAQDNPDLGSDLLFPRDGYMAARDVTDPGRAWDAKASAAFRHAVHSLHRRTKGMERAQFVSFELGRTVTQESPRKHEWKEPLWTVHHSRIDFTLDGRDMHVDVGEMTSWRGAWYVTRLRGGNAG